MSSDGLAKAKSALDWRQRVRGAWGEVRVLNSSDSTSATISVGSPVTITAAITLGSLSPDEVKVQALVGRIGPNRELMDTVAHDLEHKGAEHGSHQYEGQVSFVRPGHRGYTIRVVPRHEDVSVPSELNLVRWQ